MPSSSCQEVCNWTIWLVQTSNLSCRKFSLILVVKNSNCKWYLQNVSSYMSTSRILGPSMHRIAIWFVIAYWKISLAYVENWNGVCILYRHQIAQKNLEIQLSTNFQRKDYVIDYFVNGCWNLWIRGRASTKNPLNARKREPSIEKVCK